MMHLRRFAPTAVQFDPERVSSLHWNHCPVLPESASIKIGSDAT